MLGLFNVFGMFDISGMMWMVIFLFIYGLKSVWIFWLWLVFNQIFLMVFFFIWLWCFGVMIGVEWIKFWFGDGWGVNFLYMIVVIFVIVVVIIYVVYGFIGIGKFVVVFLFWQLVIDVMQNEIIYGLIFMILIIFYVVKGGMFSVVFMEVLQYVIMIIVSVVIGIIGM